MDALTARRGLLLAVAVIVLAAFAYLRAPGVAAGSDYLRLHSLDRGYWRAAVGHARLPLWNPHVGLGRPFAADIQTVTFYPPTLFYLLGARAGLVLSTVLHVLVLAAGMRRLGRTLGMSTSVADGMALVAPLAVGARFLDGQVPFFEALCYFPLALALALPVRESWAVHYLARLAVVLGLQVMAGHPQVAWITWLTMALFFVGSRLHDFSGASLLGLVRDLTRLSLAILWGLAMGAVVLFPFAELVGQGNRSVPSLDFASSYALPRAALGSLFLAPSEHLMRLYGTENSLYAGVLVALAGLSALIVFVRRRREVAGLALALVVLTLLALGTETPLFAAAYHLLPGLSGFRLPSRLAAPVPFCLLALAGIYLSAPHPPRLPVRASFGLVVLALSSGAWMYLQVPRAWGVEWLWLGGRLAALVCGVALLWVWNAHPHRRPAAMVAMSVVVLLDLGDVVRVSRIALAEQAPPQEALLAEILKRPEFALPGGAPPRVLVPFEQARHNAGMALGFSTPAGYVALTLDRVWSSIHEGIGIRAPLNNTFPSPEIFSRPFPYETMSLSLGFDGASGRLLGRAPDPRVYVTPCAEPVETWRAAVARMAGGHDVHRCALVESPYAAAIPRALGGGRADIVSFEPERIVIDVDAEGDALVVLAEAWYPGWTASVDGRPVECFPVNAWMRAAVVPAGHHRMTLRYRSRFLGAGAVVSLASLLAAAVAWRRRQPA